MFNLVVSKAFPNIIALHLALEASWLYVYLWACVWYWGLGQLWCAKLLREDDTKGALAKIVIWLDVKVGGVFEFLEFFFMVYVYGPLAYIINWNGTFLWLLRWQSIHNLRFEHKIYYYYVEGKKYARLKLYKRLHKRWMIKLFYARMVTLAIFRQAWRLAYGSLGFLALALYYVIRIWISNNALGLYAYDLARYLLFHFGKVIKNAFAYNGLARLWLGLDYLKHSLIYWAYNAPYTFYVSGIIALADWVWFKLFAFYNWVVFTKKRSTNHIPYNVSLNMFSRCQKILPQYNRAQVLANVCAAAGFAIKIIKALRLMSLCLRSRLNLIRLGLILQKITRGTDNFFFKVGLFCLVLTFGCRFAFKCVRFFLPCAWFALKLISLLFCMLTLMRYCGEIACILATSKIYLTFRGFGGLASSNFGLDGLVYWFFTSCDGGRINVESWGFGFGHYVEQTYYHMHATLGLDLKNAIKGRPSWDSIKDGLKSIGYVGAFWEKIALSEPDLLEVSRAAWFECWVVAFEKMSFALSNYTGWWWKHFLCYSGAYASLWVAMYCYFCALMPLIPSFLKLWLGIGNCISNYFYLAFTYCLPRYISPSISEALYHSFNCSLLFKLSISYWPNLKSIQANLTLLLLGIWANIVRLEKLLVCICAGYVFNLKELSSLLWLNCELSLFIMQNINWGAFHKWWDFNYQTLFYYLKASELGQEVIDSLAGAFRISRFNKNICNLSFYEDDELLIAFLDSRRRIVGIDPEMLKGVAQEEKQKMDGPVVELEKKVEERWLYGRSGKVKSSTFHSADRIWFSLSFGIWLKGLWSRSGLEEAYPSELGALLLANKLAPFYSQLLKHYFLLMYAIVYICIYMHISSPREEYSNMGYLWGNLKADYTNGQYLNMLHETHRELKGAKRLLYRKKFNRGGALAYGTYFENDKAAPKSKLIINKMLASKLKKQITLFCALNEKLGEFLKLSSKKFSRSFLWLNFFYLQSNALDWKPEKGKLPLSDPVPSYFNLISRRIWKENKGPRWLLNKNYATFSLHKCGPSIRAVVVFPGTAQFYWTMYIPAMVFMCVWGEKVHVLEEYDQLSLVFYFSLFVENFDMVYNANIEYLQFFLSHLDSLYGSFALYRDGQQDDKARRGEYIYAFWDSGDYLSFYKDACYSLSNRMSLRISLIGALSLIQSKAIFLVYFLQKLMVAFLLIYWTASKVFAARIRVALINPNGSLEFIFNHYRFVIKQKMRVNEAYWSVYTACRDNRFN